MEPALGFLLKISYSEPMPQIIDINVIVDINGCKDRLRVCTSGCRDGVAN